MCVSTPKQTSKPSFPPKSTHAGEHICTSLDACVHVCARTCARTHWNMGHGQEMKERLEAEVDMVRRLLAQQDLHEKAQPVISQHSQPCVPYSRWSSRVVVCSRRYSTRPNSKAVSTLPRPQKPCLALSSEARLRPPRCFQTSSTRLGKWCRAINKTPAPLFAVICLYWLMRGGWSLSSNQAWARRNHS